MAKRKYESTCVDDERGPDRKILIAVDFGTTFSGISWLQTRKPEAPQTVIQWPDATSGGMEGATNDKVPTEIVYNGQDYKWGYQIGDMDKRYSWFKLDLDPTQCRRDQLAGRVPHTSVAKPDKDVEVTKLVTDYLTALRKHVEQVLRHKLPQSAISNTPVEYILTVPAVWSDAAQSKTRLCAQQAGMGAGSLLNLIAEPEAAAMYALDQMDPHNIQVGDTFVLVDAGGGTVDLISYTVEALKPMLKIKEATAGSGSLCGASYLNRIFLQYLRAKFGHMPEWDDEVAEDAMKRFETVVKKQFCGSSGDTFTIPVPGLRDNQDHGIRRGKFAMPSADVKEIFEPVVSEILHLILGQVNAATSSVRAILMVGGFGANGYLRDRIRQEVAGFGIEVMQSPNGWTAVVRGALMKGLASTTPFFAKVGISGRCARKHYGIKSSKSFIAGEHDAEYRKWKGFEGKWKITTMDWLIKKGSEVKEDTPIRFKYYRTQHTILGPIRMHVTSIMVCSDPDNTGAPTYEWDAGVTELVKLRADLSRIPQHIVPKVRGADGHVYFMLNFEIEVTLYSAYTKYELVHNGMNYGQVVAEYV